METNLVDMLDGLSLKEMDGLLSENIPCKVEAKTTARIKASVFRKARLKKRYLWDLYSKNVMVASLIACMMVLTGFAGGYHYYQTPVHYLDVDINPSMELGINRWDRIVSAKGYNSEGETILEVTDVLNKKVEKGIREIVKAADGQGFFAKEGGGAIMLTSVADNDEEAQKLTNSAKSTVESYSAEQEINVEIVIEHVAIERRDEAKEIGLSPGKLNLIQKLQALDDQVAVENYKGISVKEIMKSIKELKKDEKSKLEIDEQEDEQEDEKNSKKNSSVNNKKDEDKIENKKVGKEQDTRLTNKEKRVEEQTKKEDVGKQQPKKENKQEIKEERKQETREEIEGDRGKTEDKQNGAVNDKLDKAEKESLKIDDKQKVSIGDQQETKVNDRPVMVEKLEKSDKIKK